MSAGRPCLMKVICVQSAYDCCWRTEAFLLCGSLNEIKVNQNKQKKTNRCNDASGNISVAFILVIFFLSCKGHYWQKYWKQNSFPHLWWHRKHSRSNPTHCWALKQQPPTTTTTTTQTMIIWTLNVKNAQKAPGAHYKLNTASNMDEQSDERRTVSPDDLITHPQWPAEINTELLFKWQRPAAADI